MSGKRSRGWVNDGDLPSLMELLKDIYTFSRAGGGMHLRSYQIEAVQAVVESVLLNRGLSIVIMFPRQSGKNECQAQVEAFLLARMADTKGEMVKISPTWKPQTQNAMRRLEQVIMQNRMTKDVWVKESGYIYRFQTARLIFLSGSPTTHIVGATASILLQVDEAQSVSIEKYDRDIAPMAASTNATRVFWGTAWTSRTLLARELRAARQAERKDGIRRVFRLAAPEVAAEVPAYGRFVEEQVEKLGRNHPLVKTQYFSEEIDAEGGMFPPARRQLMRGSHERQEGPTPGRRYALLVDVAGEDEGLSSATGEGTLLNPGRDATALTVIEIDRARLNLMRYPTYRVVDRRLWVGTKHTTLYGQILALAEHWQPARLVVDATGVGAGLASFLERALPGKVRPFVFSQASKSTLGWDFLAVIETGRFLDWRPSSPAPADEQAEFWQQVEHCTFEALAGPERRVRWGVPDSTRDPYSGLPVHDDLLISAALCAVLDGEEWGGEARSEVIPAPDPLDDLGW
jgi:hypothetical protein